MMMDISFPKFDIYQGIVTPNCFKSHKSSSCFDFLEKHVLSDVPGYRKIRRFTVSVPVLILPLSSSCCIETEKFRVYLCLETSVQTEDDSKVTSQAFQ